MTRKEDSSLVPSHPKKNRSGSTLLDRPPPLGYQEEWIESLKKAQVEEVTEGKNCLAFRFDNEWLALPSDSIKEVTKTTKVHKLPHRTTEILRGLTNVHGELYITISMRSFLSLEDSSYPQPSLHSHSSLPSYRRSVVFGYGKNDFLFSVDEVLGLVSYQDTALQEVPLTVGKSYSNFVLGLFDLNNKHIALLDAHRLVNSLGEHIL